MDVVKFPVSDRPLVLDGGLATELQANGHDLSDRLWSARLLADDPAAIVAAHRAFYAAGAAVATTASYQASFAGFAERGVSHADAAALLRRSVELADAARTELAQDGRDRWVAASVGPYGAALADGSEYRGRYGLSVAALADWHRPRLEALAAAGPDLFALETIPDVDEAEALVTAVAGLGVPAWLTYTIAGSRTRAGQPLSDAFAAVADAPDIVAVGVNCCAPGDVAPAIAVARAVTGKPVLVYPNSGQSWDGQHWAGPGAYSAKLAAGWIANGACAVGGCCQVTPADIAAVSEVLRSVRARGTARSAGRAPGLE
jgi:homocysteine S-methyltransferase